jgi:hypothetical protein
MSFIGTGAIFFTGIPPWKQTLIFTMNVAGFLTIVPGYHFYGHYFLQWMPAVCAAGAAFFFTVQDFLERMLKPGMAATLIPSTMLALFAGSNLMSLNEYYFRPDETGVLRQVYGMDPFPESRVVADKLNMLMKPEDGLAVLGTEIQMYVYTNRKSPSRFAGSGALLEFLVPQSKDWQTEFIGDVEKAAPRFLVYFAHPKSWMKDPKAEDLISPWYENFVRHYRVIGYADMSEKGTNYVWEPDVDMANRPPKGEYKIFVWERNPH